MKKSYLLSLILLGGMFQGCVNCNLAWRGQIDTRDVTQKTNFGHAVSTPEEYSGTKSIDAGKEFNDAFNADTDVSSGKTQKKDEKKDPTPVEKEVKK